jgi:hypothetical protein
MAVDPRFQRQRELLLMWYASPDQEGHWWRKDQLPPRLSHNQEALARRSRELVELGRLDQKTARGVAYYRFPTPTQRDAMPQQRALL